MKRTEQWWATLTSAERSELHWLEKYNSKWSIRNSIFQPGERRKCGVCCEPCLEAGLCSTCSQRLDFLINKADQAIRQMVRKIEKKDTTTEPIGYRTNDGAAELVP